MSHWVLDQDYRVNSAGEFFRDKLYRDIYFDMIDDIADDIMDYWDIIECLIEEYGSDYDLIDEVVNKKFPSPEHFVLIDFIEDLRACEDYFRIRVWRAEQ